MSETLRQKKALETKLVQLNELDPETPSSTALATSYLDQNDVNTIHRRRNSTQSKTTAQMRRQDSDLAKVAVAVEADTPLDDEQIDCFRRIIKTEIDGLNEELRGKCSPESKNLYPHNLNIRDFAGFIPLPTLVYELEYPRQERINWSYVAEKTAATFGVLIVMNVVSQSYIYPPVIMCLEMKEQGMPLQQRLQEMPWILSDLLFPFMLEYLLAWYVIWECIVSSPIYYLFLPVFPFIIAVTATFFPLTCKNFQSSTCWRKSLSSRTGASMATGGTVRRGTSFRATGTGPCMPFCCGTCITRPSARCTFRAPRPRSSPSYSAPACTNWSCGASSRSCGAISWPRR